MGTSEASEQSSSSAAGGAEPEQRPLVGVVGPCAAGKSVLVHALRARGTNAREVAQEHSYIPDMWLRITAPDLLVFLDVSLKESQRRRPTDITEAAWAELGHRLDHARRNADLLIDTDGLTPEEILERAVLFLESPAARQREASEG